MLSVYGSTGFIGSRFCEKLEKDCIRIPRESRTPQSNNILYFISTTHNYNVFDDPFLDIDTNLRVLIETLEACKERQGATGEKITFNFISSWFVYGDVDLPAKETSPCNPKGFYSITKKAAEELLASYCETFEMDYRILRLSNVLGLTDDKISKQKNALQFLISKIKNHEDIDLYWGGDFIRDYIHVDDACDAILWCTNHPDSKLKEIYNIGSGVPTSFKDLIDYIIDETDSKSRVNSVDQPEFHKVVQVKDMYLDISRLRKLGYTPSKNVYNTINKIL